MGGRGRRVPVIRTPGGESKRPRTRGVGATSSPAGCRRPGWQLCGSRSRLRAKATLNTSKYIDSTRLPEHDGADRRDVRRPVDVDRGDRAVQGAGAGPTYWPLSFSTPAGRSGRVHGSSISAPWSGGVGSGHRGTGEGRPERRARRRQRPNWGIGLRRSIWPLTAAIGIPATAKATSSGSPPEATGKGSRGRRLAAPERRRPGRPAQNRTRKWGGPRGGTW